MDPVVQHLYRLRMVCGAILLSCGVYGLVVALVPAPEKPPVTQANHLLWVFALISLVNVVTLLPVYRAMLATPTRVYAVSQDLEPLLSAHFAAHIVAFARLEVVAVLGLLLYFVAGRADWFWAFNGVAMLGMVALWPREDKLRALVGVPDVPRSP